MRQKNKQRNKELLISVATLLVAAALTVVLIQTTASYAEKMAGQAPVWVASK